MIELDFSLVVLVYTLMPMLFMFALFLFFGGDKKIAIENFNKIFIQQCSVCFHICRKRKAEPFFQCPICGSYNERTIKDLITERGER